MEKITKEERQLLLKDLCARLSYGVKCQFIWTFSNETTNGEDVITEGDDNIRCINFYTKEIQADYYGEWVDLEHCKPYLRPMSSMTEEEDDELNYATMGNYGENADWLNEHHFDYRGLIEKGLALEAPYGMYKTE